MSDVSVAMTYAELKAEIDRLTPEQLQQSVIWIGDCRGGKVKHVEVLEEDQVNPSGDGWEPVSLYLKTMEEEGGEDDEPRVARKGQPLLVVD